MRTLLLTTAGCAMVLAGCVTEKKKTGITRADPSRPPVTAQLPNGAIAAPVGAVANTRVQISISPLGSVPYDGQVLPLVSPDAGFLAVEEGSPPDWPTLLAAADSTVPLSTRISVYDIHRDPSARPARPGQGIRRVTFAQPLPSGLILGRAADSEGFLVESPRPDGSRWIGKVAWASGRLEWLARDNRVNAHAVLATGGELIFTRRTTDSPITELVIRDRSGAEDVRAEPGGAFLAPMSTADPAAVYAILVTDNTMELVCVALLREPPVTGPARFGPMITRANIASGSDPAVAFQLSAPVQSTGPLAVQTDGRAPEPLALYHPRLQRTAAFDKNTALFTPLAPQSVAATYWSSPSEQGFFCTTPEGVVFTPYAGPREGEDLARRTPDARVLGSAYVARRTTSAEVPFVMLGPSKQDPSRIQVAAMTVARGEPAATAP
jgi:hypothetical protein